MKVRTVLITGDLEGGQGDNDFVDLHCEIKLVNGEVLDKTIEKFPYSPNQKNVCFDILEDEIFEMVKELNLNDEEKRFLSEKSQDSLERLVYKVWRTEGTI